MKHLFKVRASYKDKKNKWHHRGETVELDGVESMMPRRNGKLIRIHGSIQVRKKRTKQVKKNESKSQNIHRDNSSGSARDSVRSGFRKDYGKVPKRK